MTPVYQPVGLRLDGRRYCLGSERELRLGVCFLFRLFNVAPETTARFSYIDDQSRSLSPPRVSLMVERAVQPGQQLTGRRTRRILATPERPGGSPNPGRRPAASAQRWEPSRVAARASRAASRPASLAAMAWRLSYCRRP